MNRRNLLAATAATAVLGALRAAPVRAASNAAQASDPGAVRSDGLNPPGIRVAGIRMLPVAQPDGWSTALEALTYAVLMIPVSLLPFWLHMDGKIYAGIAIALGLAYLGYTIRFMRIVRARSETESRMYARDLLKVSVIYLPLLLTALMLNAR